MQSKQIQIPSDVILVKCLDDQSLQLAEMSCREGRNVLLSNGEIEFLHGEDEYDANGVYEYTVREAISIKGGTYCLDMEFDAQGEIRFVTVYVTKRWRH